ncbi:MULTISPECIES: hypothetical protein [unclassified Exiguobacterium]|nr:MULTISPECIES: hypothetical protein [Exiguobacterium]
MQSATAHYGQIDVVVNIELVDFKFDPVAQKSFIDLQWKDYQKKLNETLKAAFHIIQSVLPQFMERNSGGIIRIGTRTLDVMYLPLMNVFNSFLESPQWFTASI